MNERVAEKLNEMFYEEESNVFFDWRSELRVL